AVRRGGQRDGRRPARQHGAHGLHERRRIRGVKPRGGAESPPPTFRSDSAAMRQNGSMARPLTFAGAGLWYKKRQGRDRARQLEKAEMTKTMVRSVLVAAVLATGSFAAGAQNAPTT